MSSDVFRCWNAPAGYRAPHPRDNNIYGEQMSASTRAFIGFLYFMQQIGKGFSHTERFYT